MYGVICTVVLAALSLNLITTHAFPDGAPRSVCYSNGTKPATLAPNHPAGNASDAPGGYFIDSDLRDTDFFFNGSEQKNYTSKRKNSSEVLQFIVLSIQLRCSPRGGHFGGL